MGRHPLPCEIRPSVAASAPAFTLPSRGRVDCSERSDEQSGWGDISNREMLWEFTPPRLECFAFSPTLPLEGRVKAPATHERRFSQG
jgi:hypothetical protein